MVTGAPVTRCANLVGGEWTASGSERTYIRENPAALGEEVAVVPDSDAADVDQAVEHVSNGYQAWAATPPEVRADVLMKAADLLATRADELAVELVREEGKTLAEARMETRRTPQNLRMYAGECLRLYGESVAGSAGSMVLTLRKPVGVVAAITPWNFPLNIPSRKLGPALAAGNGVVFKPSELTPVLGQRLVEALLEAGVPGSALALVHGHAEVGKALVTDPRIAAVTFTGSTAVGEAIHANVPPWVRCQLEMGGKNAMVVWEDADLDRAAEFVIKGAFGLAGQACTGTSRVVVHARVVNGLLDRLMELAQATVVGNGLDEGVTMGPLASVAQQEKHQAYLRMAREDGAHLETPTHQRAPTGGHFVRPTIFTGVRPDDRLAQEEVFSPILAFFVTSRLDTALRFADEVEAGVVKINQPTTGVAMNAPFGGLKRSSTQTFKEQAGASMMQFYTPEKTAYFTA
jgi:alpha-ketoglutaric semialdehyde dehydrogenase